MAQENFVLTLPTHQISTFLKSSQDFLALYLMQAIIVTDISLLLVTEVF